jgi:uncharacterized membrane protein YebE (DUF533 family)
MLGEKMTQKNFDQDHVSTSKLYMLRCLVAMAHADGVFCDLERAYIANMMDRIPLNDEQRSILENDFENAQDVGDLFRYINEPRYRGEVVYFARIMAFKDGNLHPNEQQVLDHLHLMATDGLDMDGIRADVKKAVETEMMLHDIEIDKNRPMKGGHFIPYFQWLDEILLAIGVDVLR